MYKLQFAMLLACCVLCSCGLQHDTIEASFDGNKDDQGGPSGTISADAFSLNVVNDFYWGSIGVTKMPGFNFSGVSDRGEKDWLPAGYEPEASSAGGQLVPVTSLEFVQKAAKWDSYSQRLNYLVVMQDIRYLYPLGQAGTLFVGLGPYIGYGLGGSTGTGSNKVAAFSSDGYKRFDWGLHFTVGYQLPSSLNFRFAYELGLYDKSTDPSDYTSYNRTWSIGIGYSLDRIIHGVKK